MSVLSDVSHPDPVALSRRLLGRRAPIHADLHPSGDRLLVTVVWVADGTDEESIEVRLVDLADGSSRRLPGSNEGDHTATWSPDGLSVAFVSARTGLSQVHVVATDSGLVRCVSSLPAGTVGAADWSPDGRRLALCGARGRGIDRARPWRVTRAVQWADGIGALDDPPQVWIVDVESGVGRMLTDDEWRWSLPRWSPDGGTIGVRASFDPDGHRRGQHLRLVDLDGGVTEPAVPGGFAVVHDWLSDGSLVALSIQPVGRPGGSEAQLHRVHADGSIGRLDAFLPCPVGGTVYGDSAAAVGDAFETALCVDGLDVVLRTHLGGEMGVAVLSADTGAWEVLEDGARCVSPLGRSNGTLVVSEQDAESPCRLVAISRQRRVSIEWTDDPDLPELAVATRWQVGSPHDGATLDAWHLRPRGVDGPLPTVLIVHGGPNAAFGECFQIDAHALCAAGFGVVYCNPHGSTGYGDGFAHAVFDHWGDLPVADVMAVLDAAVERGWVDADRIGVSGNSYGGYLSTWMATTTTRFRAAVAENPVTDLLSLFGTSDIGATFLPMQMGVSPLDDIEPYLRWSPLLRAAECSTPLLFVAGSDDRRCPPTQAFEMHRTLRALGRVSEVLVLPGSSHEGSTFGPPAVRLAQDAALIEWMQRWLTLTLPPP